MHRRREGINDDHARNGGAVMGIRTDGMIDAEAIVAASRDPKSEHDYDQQTALLAKIASALDHKDARIRELEAEVERLRELQQRTNLSCTKAEADWALAIDRATTAERQVTELREAVKVLGDALRLYMMTRENHDKMTTGQRLKWLSQRTETMDAVNANPIAAAAIKDAEAARVAEGRE